jgi:hypothetical protein
MADMDFGTKIKMGSAELAVLAEAIRAELGS